jgi:hypothetical protein
MFHRLLTTAGVAAVVAFVVGGGAYAVASSEGSDGPVRTITVIEKSGDSAYIDLGQQGFSIGDEFTINSTFWNTARTQRLGSNHGMCVVVTTHQVQCSGTARLMGGTLAYAGLASDSARVTVIPITGGSGALESAEGQVTVHNLDANGNVSRDVIELTG